MIERYYDNQNNLLRSYDFPFPFCMPSSVNEMDATYDMPRLASEQKQAMIKAPPGTRACMRMDIANARTSILYILTCLLVYEDNPAL